MSFGENARESEAAWPASMSPASSVPPVRPASGSADGVAAPSLGRLGEVGHRVRALLAAERVSALVVPGLWGFGEALGAIAEAQRLGAGSGVPAYARPRRIDGLTLVGGRGGEQAYADLIAGVTASGTQVASVQDALAEWGALCAEGALVAVRSAAALDPDTAALLTRSVLETPVRLFVLMCHDGDTCPPLRMLERAGSMVRARIAPLDRAALSTRLATDLRVSASAVVLGRIHDLTGGHPELVDGLLAAARRSRNLVWRSEGWLWDWDDAEIRHALVPLYPQLLARLDPACELLVRRTGLAGALPEAVVDTSALHDIGTTGLLTRTSDSSPGTPLLRVGPEMLRWAVEDTTSAIETAAAWYDFGRAVQAETGSSAARTALEGWRVRVEREIDARSAAAHARVALRSGWYDIAHRLLVAAAPSAPEPATADGQVELELVTLRAELAWALGDVDGALGLLCDGRAGLWPVDDSGAPAPAAEHCPAAREASVLLFHIGVFHPGAALAVLATEGGEDVRFARALARVRAAGLTLFPDVAEMLRDGAANEAFAQVRRRSLAVRLDESALARLWLGAELGLTGAHDFGRLVLSELLDELSREGETPSFVESVHGVLHIITMFVGWTADELRVSAPGRHRYEPWLPGMAAVHELVDGVLAMQDDRMLSCLRHALCAAATVERADPFGLRPLALAMAAAAASYLPHQPAASFGAWARSQLAGLERTASFPHLALFSEGLALIGSGPPTAQVAEAVVEVAARAHEDGAAAQEQQLLFLAVLGGSPTAIATVLGKGWQRHSGRAGMIHLLARALAAGSDQESGRFVLDTAETFLASEVRFLGHTVLAARWAVETAAGHGPSRRLVRMVLRAREEAPEHSWLLGQFAHELLLTDRDEEVVRSLRHGERTGTIASRLGLSPRTVEGHISRLLGRFRCGRRLELVRLLDEFVGEPEDAGGRPR